MLLTWRRVLRETAEVAEVQGPMQRVRAMEVRTCDRPHNRGVMRVQSSLRPAAEARL